MASLNKVLLMGNLTRDVELKYTPSGMAVARIAIATNRKWRDQKTNEMKEEVTFVDVDLFGKTAELAGQYLAKGRAVFIEGRLRLDSWEDKQTGQKRNKMMVVCDRMQFVGSGGGQGGGQGGQGGGAPAQSAPRPQQSRPPQRPAPSQNQFPDDGGPGPEDLDIQEESIPF